MGSMGVKLVVLILIYNIVLVTMLIYGGDPINITMETELFNTIDDQMTQDNYSGTNYSVQDVYDNTSIFDLIWFNLTGLNGIVLLIFVIFPQILLGLGIFDMIWIG